MGTIVLNHPWTRLAGGPIVEGRIPDRRLVMEQRRLAATRFRFALGIGAAQKTVRVVGLKM